MGGLDQQAAPARGRPRAFDQEAVLDRAMMLFWRQGYEPTSVSDLSRAMGINAPSIYAAFGNKEGLFLRVLDRYLETRTSELERALRTSSTAEEGIRQLLMRAARRFTSAENPPGCLVALTAARVSPEARMIQRKLRDRRRRREALLLARIQQGIDAGELPTRTRATTLAKFYAAVFQGMAMQAADGASRTDLERVAEQAMAAWPRGVASGAR